MPPQEVRILLVEDDPDDAELVGTLLAETGRSVKITHERLLTLALRRLATDEFDLVLLDLSLPDSWGIETLRRVRKISPDLPIVLMSGATMREIDEEAKREGATECLQKHDLDSNRVTQILNEIIGHEG